MSPRLFDLHVTISIKTGVCVCVCVCIGGKYTEGLVPIKPERNRDTELLPLTD